MYRRGAAVLLALLPWAGMLSAGDNGKKDAESTDAKKGGDQTQSFDSPLPLVGGVTLTASQDKTTATLGLAQTLSRGFFWQGGIAGTATKDDAPLFSSEGGFTPGLKAKIGLGYSSFLAHEDPRRNEQVDRFLREAWCFDAASGTAKAIGDTFVNLPDTHPLRECGVVFDLLQKAFNKWRSSGPPPQAVKDVDEAIQQLGSVIAAGFTEQAYDYACKKLSSIPFAACTGQNSQNLQADHYPALFATVVTIRPRAWRFKVTANWMPSITSAKYRPVKDGTPDLPDAQKWTGFLNGGSVDATLHYRALIAGLQFAYEDGLDEDKLKPQDVCKRLAQDEFYSDDCTKAVIGKPDPFAHPTLTGAISLDPIVPSLSSGVFRPGAQLVAKWERLDEGKRRFQLSLPIYLARLDAPIGLVVGVKPLYRWDRGAKEAQDFVVSIFVGARP
jgi:hypothetical protein